MNEFKLTTSTEYQEHITLVNSKSEWRAKNPTASIESYIRYEPKIIRTWKTLIQTPYAATMPYGEFEKIVWSNLIHFLEELCIIKKQDSNTGQYYNWHTVSQEGTLEINGLYRWLFKQNFQKGYWEIEIYHTLPLYMKTVLREHILDVKKISNPFSPASGGEQLNYQRDPETERFFNKYLYHER